MTTPNKQGLRFIHYYSPSDQTVPGTIKYLFSWMKLNFCMVDSASLFPAQIKCFHHRRRPRWLFFLKFFIYYLFIIFIFGCVGSLFLCEGFLQLRRVGATLHRGARASLLRRPLLLRSTGSVIVAHGPSCSAACGIFPDQGSNPCPLHWQADSQPLRHQGSPHPRWLLTKVGLSQPILRVTSLLPCFIIFLSLINIWNSICMHTCMYEHVYCLFPYPITQG